MPHDDDFKPTPEELETAKKLCLAVSTHAPDVLEACQRKLDAKIDEEAVEIFLQ